MGKSFAKKIRGMSLRTKISIVFMLLMGSFLYQGIFKPLIGDSATNSYYFTLDTIGTVVNTGADGNTNTIATRGGKISMKIAQYATSQRVTANTVTAEQTMMTVYGPAYTIAQSLSGPAITIGARGTNGAGNTINWKAYVYDYNPAGAAGNGTLLWTSDGGDHLDPLAQSVQAPLPLTFTAPAPKTIAAGHRLKVVISCQMASTSAGARLYWGGGANYSFMTVTEGASSPNSVVVTNLADYNNGGLTNVLQGEKVAMLEFDLYTNVSGSTVTWSGGLLDKIGTNTRLYVDGTDPGDVSFSVYMDDGNQTFEPATDTLIGGPYNFNQATAQGYTLTTTQTITATPKRYYIVYDIRTNATPATTTGARIVNNSYFTVSSVPVVAPAVSVINVTSTSSGMPQINSGGAPILRNYPADWDDGTSRTWGSTSFTTNSPNIVRSTAVTGADLIGLLNYPLHTYAGVAGQNYTTTTARPAFITLYFAGAGYPSDMTQIKGSSFTYRFNTPAGGGTATLRLFYVAPDGTRVNSPVSSIYRTTGTTNATVTTSLAGQTFTAVPLGARMGIQIGVAANTSGTCGIGLGSSVGSQLTVEETAAENNNVDVGDGSRTPNASVYASATGSLVNSFTLSASKTQTINSVTITGNAVTNGTNVKTAKLYADIGTTIGALDAGDTLVGSSSAFSGNSITISGLNLSVSTALKRFLVVYDIGDNPNTNVLLTGLVSNIVVANPLALTPAPAMGNNGDTTSGTLTILPTTKVSDFITSEPPSIIIPSGAGATKVDAFGLKTNGGVDDTISNVTVALTTTSSLPLGKVISDYVGRVDIITSAGTSLGHLTAPTSADNWQVSTASGLVATQAGAEYFVTITPKGNQNITFAVKAKVIDVAHSRLNNALVLSDTGSATIIMDQLPPAEPTLSAVTGTYHNDTDRAEVDLSWNGSADASGSAVSYILVRGLGNAPAPRSCTADGTKTFSVYSGTNLSATDKGLDEGVSYGYRVCAVDSVGNISAGSTKTTTASIKNRCTELPQLTISPVSSYVKAGNTVGMSVGITNMDTGSCAATTFTLSIVGTDVDDSNYTVSTFDGNDFIIPTNNGSKYTHLRITAKPGAAEKAVKTFQVKVTKSSGGETSYPAPVYVIVNKYGTMTHSSLQLGTSKFGSWGLDYNCATCHSPDSTNIKQVKNIITTPTGDRPVTFSMVSTSRNADITGVFGNDNRSGAASSNVCEVCHHKARFHQYSASKVAWKEHNNNGDCMKCHSHSIGFKTVAISGSCDDCHGNPPTTQAQLVVPPTNVLFPYGTNAGSHEKHNSRQLKCTACHSSANHTSSSVPDTVLNMGFNIKGSNFTGFIGNITSGTFRALPPGNDYTWLGAVGTTIEQAPATIMTCNVYCHGWPGNGGYNSEPAWTGINQVGCGSCHAASGSNPPASGSHHKHASSEAGFGNGIACGKCHGMRNYSTSSAHINGNVEWDLSTITPTALYRGVNQGSTGSKAPTAPGSYGACSNLYCHSNVQSANGTAGPTVFSNPTWGGTTSCNSCHPGQPNTTGGHPQHAGAGVTGFDCRICHASGGDANPLNHANDKIDFMFVGLGENTHYSYSSAKVPGSAAYGTCYNGNCHGTRRNIPWAAANDAIPLCDKCHGSSSSTGGFYSTAGPGSTTSNTDPYVGAHFRHLTSAAPYKYSAKIGCNGCHFNPEGPYTPGHIDTPLPAEINFGALASSGVQGGYTSSAHQPVYNYGAKQCNNVWCHGGGMHSNEGLGAYGSAVDDGGTLGTPVSAVWNVPFLTGVGTNDCVKCHSFPPPAPLPGYTHYDDATGLPYAANKCILCHKHVDSTGYAFKNPALHVNGVVDSCNTCHGRPPIDDAGLTTPAIGALNPGFVGAHQAHAINPNIGKDCAVCHYNYSQEMPSYNMEIGFSAFGGKVTSGTFYGYSTLAANYTPEIVYKSTNAGTTVRRTNDTSIVNTCANLYCHGGGTATLGVLGGGTNIKPNWEGGISQAECGSCHGTDSSTYVTRGSHGRHAGITSGQLGLACANCHGIKENNYHVDGKVEWEFYSSVKRMNQLPGYVNPQYTPATGTAGASGNTGTLAPSATYGTCAVYCHSDGKGNYANPLPVWGGGPLNCGSCHKDQTVNPTGSHAKHAVTYGIACSLCHYEAGSGSVKHANGTIDIIFNSNVVGSGTYNSTTGICSNIVCHVTTAGTLKWGDASTLAANPATCIGCHSGAVGNRAAVVPQFGGQSHHVQGVTLSNSHCYQCHMEAADTSGNINATYHDKTAGKPVDLVIWGANTRGTSFTSYLASAASRTEYAKVSTHCLGCHNLQNSTTTPINPFGDGKNPKSYAWDAKSVDERYSQSGTTTWGKYAATANAAKKNITKAFSAHGNSANNARGWDTTNGVDGTITNTSGSVNVLCYDCHNSHGTSATGIMSSYSSATGRYKGAILKSTTTGKGGYSATYTPTTGGSAAAPSKNAYNAGAALCFDCHNNASASATRPWGYGLTASGGTFNATQAIFGYRDAPYFGNNSFGTGTRYPYKNLSSAVRSSKMNHGGHFGASTPLTTSVGKQINGLCTPCHDPHGVTTNSALVSDQNYGVPLLKGTWMTSPYKEDVAPVNKNEARGGTNESSTNGTSGGSTTRPIRQLVGSTPMYYIDQNTFGTTTNSNQTNYGSAQNAPSWTFPNAAGRITQTDAQFAGLCMQCHTKAALAPKAGQAVAPDTWKSASRIHGTVKGWATTTAGSDGNASNAIHSYSCSKCHSPHNSNLPRLMVTNCLDFNHRGQVVSGGTVSATAGNSGGASGGTSIANSGHQSVTGQKGSGAGRFPAGGNYKTRNSSTKSQNPGIWFFGLTATSGAGAYRNCHDTANTIDAAYPNKQYWNSKTPW